MATSMEFALLGPLEVRCGGATLPVPRGHQRTVLAVLLLNANRPVSVNTLAEALWGTAPPPSAEATIRNYVRRLRTALGDAGRRRIVTQPRGYLIRVEDGELDVPVCAGLLASALASARTGSWHEAAGQARQALALWRGEPLCDIEAEALACREVPGLAEMRWQLLETRIDAELHLGGHAEVVPELRRLVAASPLREHPHALLMLALYRCGRQADALAAYQQARAVLASELGAEPGAELRRLHQQILAADGSLAAPPVVGPAGAPVVPRQLPAATARFTARTAQLAALDQMLDRGQHQAPGAVVISAIGGTAGVGKSALAIYWAHQAAGWFPDGQLYVDLRGFGSSGEPVTPAQAIRGFLDALGAEWPAVPAGADAQAGLYRSLLARRRMLIVLDNARDERQVRPLLPGSPGCVVLITSRNQLGGLVATDGARLLTLDVFTPAEARQMLAAGIGEARAAAEPGALAEIVGLCACLPLALAVTAARAALRPRFPLTALAAELRGSAGRLHGLSTGEDATDVGTVFSWSYQQLSPPAARMFRLLGLHPGPDVSTGAAASLAGTDQPGAHDQLRELARCSLLTEHVPGRYRCHDLLRVYASAQAEATDSAADRRAAAERALDYYLHTACAATLLLNPAREQISLPPARPGATPGKLASHEQARDWFEAEHQVLLNAVALAASHGFDRHAWQLPWAAGTFLDWRGNWQERAAIQETAVSAAVRLGDKAAEAVTRRLLAIACSRLGHYEEAGAGLATCLRLYQQLGDRGGQARVHEDLVWLAEHLGRFADALWHAEQALGHFQATGDLAGQAAALNNAGWQHALLGDYRRARTFCRQALVLHRDLGLRFGQAHTWDSLGYAEHHLGHLGEAATCYRNAVALFRELGDRVNEATSLVHLGDIHHARALPEQARDAWTLALDIFSDLRHPGGGQLRSKLGQLPAPAPGRLVHAPGLP